ncbi:hypothetical protein OHC50_02115 [Paenarthrobacter ilicis]|uniref:hypothetical protein n=1 Tax=Paenarthrobacter ilicis TaxID=43665 RepID=UPI00300BF5B7
MLGYPTGTLLLKRLDLVARGAVQLFTRNIIVDLGRTFAVRTVGTADVLGVRDARRALFPGVATVVVEGAAVIAVTTGTIEIAGTTLRAVTTIVPVTERLTVTAVVVERTTLTITSRTIIPVAERLTVTTVVVERTTLTITSRTIIPVAERLTVTTVVVERTTLTITSRTITEGAAVIAITTGTIEIAGTALRAVTTIVPVAERLAISAVVVERTTLTITSRTITEGAAVIAITTGTIEIAGTALRAVTTIVPVTERLAISAVVVERTTLTITSRTIIPVTKRLTVTAVVVERTTLTITSRTIAAAAALV